MKFSLIICTYRRAKSLIRLLNSINSQTLYPNEILVIDGSKDDETLEILEQNSFFNLSYFKVDDKDRGLTRQRNFGIQRVNKDSEIVCFLDDDTVLNSDYFEKIISTYRQNPEALGVGGYIIDNVNWYKVPINYVSKIEEYVYDGWARKDGSRFVLRKKLGLDSNVKPAHMPEFSHGRSVSFLPPSGKIYPVEQFMGGVSSFKKSIFESMKFSTYFEGYGLYEDADFTLRLSKKGELYVNTGACLLHLHDADGRPNKFQYGKMVVRNGWYVWRVKYPNPRFIAVIKWNLLVFILSFLRLANAITTKKRVESFTESMGRFYGWISLIFLKPKIEL